jgi:hypothetical protein
VRLFGASALLLIAEGVNVGLYFGGRETGGRISCTPITDLRFRDYTLRIILGTIPLLFRGSQNFSIHNFSSKLTAR